MIDAVFGHLYRIPCRTTVTRDEAENPQPDSALSHLSVDQIQEVIDLYYADVPVDEILSTYNIDARRYQLAELLPPEVIADAICPYCDLPMWRKRRSRSARFVGNPHCPACNHEPMESCQCRNCRDAARLAAESERERKRQILSSQIDLSQYTPIPYADLSVTDRTYLGAVLRAGLTEDLSAIMPLGEFQLPFAPTETLRREIFDALSSQQLLVIHPRSSIDAFTDVTDDGSFRYYIYRVYLHLNVSRDGNREALIDHLMNPPTYLPGDTAEILRLWRRIALAEALEYLLYQMELVGFDFSPGKKTDLVLRDLLSNFSTAQVYGVIWSGVTQATRFFQEGNVSRQHAANSVITNCQRYGEKAVSNRWDLKCFSRIRDLRQSTLSKIFYNRVLGIGDSGFDEVPRDLYPNRGSDDAR